MLDSLILFLLFFLLFLIFLSLIFYYRVKAREYYYTNTVTGDALVYTPTDNLYRLQAQPVAGGAAAVADLVFTPFYEDRKRTIRGRLVLTTNSSNTASQFFTVRVMDGPTQLSKGVYEIKPNIDSNYIYFKANPGDTRSLTVEIQKYNPKTQLTDFTRPTGLNLVHARGYYYY